MHPLEHLKRSLPEIEQRLGYFFSDKTVLLQACTHRSIINEIDTFEETVLICNERLEFLGDAVIGLYVAKKLYVLHPDWYEGTLSQAKALLVSEKSLQRVMDDLDLKKFIVMGKGERIQKSYELPSIQADFLEAIIGAIYLDGGMSAVEQVLEKVLGIDFFTSSLLREDANPKAELQEMLAKSGLSLPEYRLEQEEGPHHERKFFMSVVINGLHLGRGSGISKKEAQKKAAKEALDYIKEKGLPHFETNLNHSAEEKK